MKLFNEPYDTLSDPARRRAYDADCLKTSSPDFPSPDAAPKPTRIRFTCGACNTALEADLGHAHSIVKCPGCGQQLRLRPAQAQPAGAGAERATFRTQFTNEKLRQLRDLHRSKHRPGDVCGYVGGSLLAVILLVLVWFSWGEAPRSSVGSSRPGVSAGIILLFGLIGVGGAVGLF